MKKDDVLDELRDAIWYCEPEKVRKCLKTRGLDINQIHTGGKRDTTPLMLACSEGRDDIIDDLMDYPGIDIDAETEDGETAISFAANSRTQKCEKSEDVCADLVRNLICHGANVNRRNKDGRTPLMEAADHKSPDTAKILLRAGANPNAKDNRGDNALFIAIEAESYKVAKVLIQSGTNLSTKDEFGRTALYYVLEREYYPILKEFSNDKEYTQRVRDHAYGLICENNVEGFETLTSNITLDLSELDEEDNSYLHVAAENGGIKIAKLLLRNEHIRERLNQQTSTGETALMLAVKNNDIDMVDLLTDDYECDIHLKNNEGKTAAKFTTDTTILEMLRKKDNEDEEDDKHNTYKYHDYDDEEDEDKDDEEDEEDEATHIYKFHDLAEMFKETDE